MGGNCCEMVVARSEELLTRVWHLSDSLQVSRAVTPRFPFFMSTLGTFL